MCSLSERAFQVREKVMTAANWGSGNYLIVKENYIAEQIAPYVNILLIRYEIICYKPLFRGDPHDSLSDILRDFSPIEI